jgi:hypothetical protein
MSELDGNRSKVPNVGSDADRIYKSLAAKLHQAINTQIPQRSYPPDCHPDDRELLSAVQYLKRGLPMNEIIWRVLVKAAVRRDLFIVARRSPDPADRVGRLKKGPA